MVTRFSHILLSLLGFFVHTLLFPLFTLPHFYSIFSLLENLKSQSVVVKTEWENRPTLFIFCKKKKKKNQTDDMFLGEVMYLKQ